MHEEEYVETSDPEEQVLLPRTNDRFLSSPTRLTRSPRTPRTREKQCKRRRYVDGSVSPTPSPKGVCSPKLALAIGEAVGRRESLERVSPKGSPFQLSICSPRDETTKEAQPEEKRPFTSATPSSSRVSTPIAIDLDFLTTADDVTFEPGYPLEQGETSLWNVDFAQYTQDALSQVVTKADDSHSDVFSIQESQDELDLLTMRSTQQNSPPRGILVPEIPENNHNSPPLSPRLIPTNEIHLTVSPELAENRVLYDEENEEKTFPPKRSTVHFSSLPPSSPIRSSDSIESSPHRVRSPSHLQDLDNVAGLSSEPDGHRQDQTSEGDMRMAQEIAAEEQGGGRRYSLRTRQARQLNPYEYDKRLYKMQLRHNPEAIVKVVSPSKRTHHNEEGQGHDRYRHTREETQGDEWIVPEEEEDSQYQYFSPPQHHRRHNRSVSDDARNTSRDVPIPSFLNPDFDEDDDIPSFPKSLPMANRIAHEEANKAKRKRLAKFPMRVSKPTTEERVEDRGKSHSWATDAVASSRRTPHHREERAIAGPSRTKSSDERTSMNSPRSSSRTTVSPAAKPQRNEFEYDDFPDHEQMDDFYNFPDFGPAHHEAGDRVQSEVDNVIPVSSDEDDNVEPSRRSGSRQRRSQAPSSHSESEDSDVRQEEERRRRKALKALGRMMPAVMIKKVIGGQEKKSRHNADSRERSSSIQPSSVGQDVSDEDIVPGHSKVRRRFGNSESMPIDIRGDSESSDSEPELVRSDSNNSSDSEEVPSGPSDDEAIEVNLLDNDFSRRYQSEASRKKEDLIDRMLSRTGVKSSSGKKRKRMFSHSKQWSVGGSKPTRGPPLDITVGIHLPRERQMRLPFPRLAAEDRDRHEIDLTRDDNENDGVRFEYEGPLKRKMSKKDRRNALIRQQTYTIPSDGKSITTGRPKRLMQVNLDDEAFREALAPVRNGKGVHPRPHGKQSSRKEQLSLRQAHIEEYGQDATLAEGFDTDFRDTRRDVLPHRQPDVWQAKQESESRTVSVDLGVPFLKPGLSFGPSSFIGKQMLHSLVALAASDGDLQEPPPFITADIRLDVTCSATHFCETLRYTADNFSDLLSLSNNEWRQAAEIIRHETLAIAICQYSSWFLSTGDSESRTDMKDACYSCIRRLMDELRALPCLKELDADLIDTRHFLVLWVVFELAFRVSVSASHHGFDSDPVVWDDLLVLILHFLLIFGPLRSLTPALQDNVDILDGISPAQRSAEIWLCLIHILPKIPSSEDAIYSQAKSTHPLWTAILKVVCEESFRAKSDFDASEQLWSIIFCVNALSQFSSHGNCTAEVRVPACWEIVTTALNAIRLSHVPAIDQVLSKSSLRKRDRYVRLVVARCYLLATRWQWSLRDANPMLNQLVEIFKSRKFSNLLGEESDFPSFMTKFNLAYLKEIRNSDSAFCIFLKLVVHAAEEDKLAAIEPRQRSQRLMKLLHLAVPVSGVAFTRDNPPTSQELSMLYNRLTSITVAIYLEPTEAKIKHWLGQARRYLKLEKADKPCRNAIIREIMHVTVLLNHLSLPIDEPLKWLSEVTEVLLVEHDMVTSANRQVGAKVVTPSSLPMKSDSELMLLAVLRSVRKIIETTNMDRTVATPPRYPDIGLLNGPWLKLLISKRELTNILATRHEVLGVVQAFLKVRAEFVPTPRRPALAPLHQDETQESQDEYGEFDLDWDDPDLIAALDNHGAVDLPLEDYKVQDVRLAEMLDSDVTPAIYRFIVQHFSDPSAASFVANNLQRYFDDADEWVDCWVGCAAVVVQSKKREWSHYLSLGPLSWERISDPALQRRVGLQFMLKLLQCDPCAYKDDNYQDSFYGVLMKSFAVFKITKEHEYVAFLCSVDGLRHAMLRDLPLDRPSEQVDFKLSPAMFLEKRADLVEGIVKNLDANLDRAALAHNDQSLTYTCQRWVGYLLSMLASMKEIYEGLADEEQRRAYSLFIHKIFDILSRYGIVGRQPRLTAFISWGSGFL